MLVWNKFGNGVVTDMSQYAFTTYGGNTDLEGLRAGFDSNADGVFDLSDAKFAEFGVWQDANGNGVADLGEFKSLIDLGVKAIHLSSDGIVREPSTGVTEAGQFVVEMADGQTAKGADASFSFQSAPAVEHPIDQGTVLDGGQDVPNVVHPIDQAPLLDDAFVTDYVLPETAPGVFTLSGNGLSLDLARIAGGPVQALDLSAEGSQMVRLSLQDLLAEQTTQPLRILGTGQDTVQVKGETVEASTVEHDGAVYQGYDLDRNGSLDLLVQQEVLVTFHN